MLNLFQHLNEINNYETLNQVQGDKIVLMAQSLIRFFGLEFLPFGLLRTRVTNRL